MTAESLGWQLRSALPPMRLHSVSLYNVDADVLFLSEGALGPDEHNVVIEAIEAQKAEKTQSYYEYGMEDGRMAVFLPIRGPRGDLAGTVMILADMKSMNEGTMERIVTPQIRTILVKIAMFMRKNSPAAAADAAPEVAMPDNATPAPVNLSSTTVIEKLPAQSAAILGPREVDQMLELELVAEPPRAPVAPVAPAAVASAAAANSPAPGKKGVSGNNSPAPKAGARAGAAQSNAAANAPPARGAPTLTSVPSMPSRDIEVLAFEPDIQIPTAKPAAAPPADIEILAFEVEPPVVSAAPVVAPPVVSPVPPMPKFVPTGKYSGTGSTSSVRALNAGASTSSAPAVKPPPSFTSTMTSVPAMKSAPTFTATMTSVPPMKAPAATSMAATAPAPAAKAAPASPATTGVAPTNSTATTGSMPAAKVAPANSIATTGSMPAVKAAPATSVSTTASVPVVKPPAPAPAAPPVMKAAPAPAPKPAASESTAKSGAPSAFADSPTSYAAKSSAASTSTAQTAAVQIISDSESDEEESALIMDTGPVPILTESALIEPTPELPPLEPLSVEESAADLTLFAQELIKLRSSGRTRRYEILARSQRDANRNEVPAAFVAESARGKDGAALDAMVVERLLIWLGKHGEALWDSEPASFSVNLSIGALEDEGFPKRIEQWLEQYSVPAEYIGFEITEFACVQCRPAVQRFVDAIEKMGCFLVIDNFSFDSSIFEMLGSKALRHVKLDPKVTTAAMKDKLPQALVVAILQACKVLGVHCVAKRVESQSSMQWLTAVGCDFAQSFSLHKPLPLESLASGQPIKALRE